MTRTELSEKLRTYGQWADFRVLLCALLFAVAVITAVSVRASLEWIDRPFNGFLMGENRIVAPIDLPGWSGRAANIPYWWQLVTIDGVEIASTDAAFAAAADAGAGAVIEYGFSDGRRMVQVPIRVMTFGIADWFGLFANYLVNGLALLAIGFVVAFLRPGSRSARALLYFSLSWGTSLVIGLADFASFHFRTLLAVAEGFVPASLFYLTLCFPNERLLARHRRLLLFVVASSAALAVLNVLLYTHAPLAWTIAYRAAVAWVVLVIALSVATAWRDRRDMEALEFEKLKIVLFGIITAFGLPFTLLGASHLVGAELPLNIVTAGWWIFPATLAYAIVQRDLFEIDVFLRRAATYVALTFLVFLAYAALLAVLTHGFHNLSVTSSPWFTLLFALAVLLAFHPLRDRLQRGVDRLLFRTHFDFASTAREVSQALNARLSHDSIADFVGDVVERTMAPASCTVYRAAGDEFHPIGCAAAHGEPSVVRVGEAVGTALAAGRVIDARDLAAETELLPATALVLPVRFESRLEGFLRLGPKNSGARYGPHDIEFLRTLANQTAMALRNAAAYDRVNELLASLETRVDERTRELQQTQLELRESHDQLRRAYDDLRGAQAQLAHSEKMAAIGTLVAGVAHEINNPVSFIHSSIDLIANSALELQEILARYFTAADGTISVAELRDEVAAGDRFANLMQNAEICRDGARRAARIVQDLRTFSRPGTQGRQRTDLHAGIDQSLRLLQGELKGRVRVQREYGDLPAVYCDPGQLAQVFLNVLANAAQAITGKGVITVRTSAEVDQVEVQISDDGPGMSAPTVEKIFDPFFSTKEVGKGTGLGLSIARSLVHAHGGDVRVASNPGHGTTFTISLPIDGVADDRAEQLA